MCSGVDVAIKVGKLVGWWLGLRVGGWVCVLVGCVSGVVVVCRGCYTVNCHDANPLSEPNNDLNKHFRQGITIQWRSTR